MRESVSRLAPAYPADLYPGLVPNRRNADRRPALVVFIARHNVVSVPLRVGIVRVGKFALIVFGDFIWSIAGFKLGGDSVRAAESRAGRRSLYRFRFRIHELSQIARNFIAVLGTLHRAKRSFHFYVSISFFNVRIVAHSHISAMYEVCGGHRSQNPQSHQHRHHDQNNFENVAATALNGSSRWSGHSWRTGRRYGRAAFIAKFRARIKSGPAGIAKRHKSPQQEEVVPRAEYTANRRVLPKD